MNNKVKLSSQFDYEELQLIIEMIEFYLAFGDKLLNDNKRGDLSYIESQKSLRNKCYKLMNQDEFHEHFYYDEMGEIDTSN